MIKKSAALISTLLLAVFLVACGNAGDNTKTGNNEPESLQNPEAVENNPETGSEGQEAANRTKDNNAGVLHEDQQEIKKKMAETNYDEFELEASYPGNKEYEAEIDKEDETGNYQVTLQDELNGQKFDGKGAFDIIYPKLKKLNIDGSTSRENAVSQVMSAFNLPQNYEKIEISFTLKNGTKMEIEDHGNH